VFAGRHDYNIIKMLQVSFFFKQKPPSVCRIVAEKWLERMEQQLRVIANMYYLLLTPIVTEILFDDCFIFLNDVAIITIITMNI